MATGMGLKIKLDSFFNSVFTEEELHELKKIDLKAYQKYQDICSKQMELFKKVTSSQTP